MTTWLPEWCPVSSPPCPPVNDGLGRAEFSGLRVAGTSLLPGLAEAGVPAPGDRLTPVAQPRTTQGFPSGPLKWRTVRLVMLTASPAATTTPSPAANVGVTISRRKAGPTFLSLGCFA